MSDVCVYLIGERATQSYCKQSVVLCAAVLSFLLGTVVSAVRAGRTGMKECFDVKSIVTLFPIAMFFGTSSICLLQCFRYFDAAFIKLMGQLKLPVTAVFSTLLLGRRYALPQWQMMVLLFTACSSFTVLKYGSTTVGAVPFIAVVCLSGWILCNVFASVIMELVYKSLPTVPFPTMMSRLEAGKLIWAIILYAWVPHTMFGGWDGTTLLVLASVICDDWLSGLMVKKLSSVTKAASKCISLTTLYAISLATGRQPLELIRVLGALMIVQTTAMFALDAARRSDAKTCALVPAAVPPAAPPGGAESPSVHSTAPH